MTHTVIFKRLTSVNFCSAGQQPVTIDLASDPLTVIVGENGTGKSSLVLDALTFALFNTPYRNINKADLVNYLLGEGTKVTLDMTIGGIETRVVRGISPNIFEVHQDGKKVSLPKHARDQQSFFETDILKFTKPAFLQTCVLGKAGYTPFLQLPAAQRRAVVEDLLDLSVFSRMHKYIKEDVSAQKVDVAEKAAKLSAADENLKAIHRIQREAEQGWKDKLDGLQTRIDDLENAVADFVVPNGPDEDMLAKSEKARSKLDTRIAEIRAEQRTCSKIINGIDDADTCPTCGQPIDNTHKKEEKAKAEAKFSMLGTELSTFVRAKQDLSELVNKLDGERVERDRALQEKSKLQTRLESQREQYAEMEAEGPPQLPDVDAANQRFSEAQKADEIARKKMDIYLCANRLLKDDGIKASVVRRYLPAMTSQLNSILRHFDLDIRFLFSETFEETIYRHGIYKLKIDNFSEGEKLRIELALLFCWRALAQQKASMSTNLLVMDEILDASLDDAGVSQLMKQLRDIGGANTFIISHRKIEDLTNDFDAVLHFKKVGHYTSVDRVAV